jgi:hypothetical protein
MHQNTKDLYFHYGDEELLNWCRKIIRIQKKKYGLKQVLTIIIVLSLLVSCTKSEERAVDERHKSNKENVQMPRFWI